MERTICCIFRPFLMSNVSTKQQTSISQYQSCLTIKVTDFSLVPLFLVKCITENTSLMKTRPLGEERQLVATLNFAVSPTQ